MEVRERDSVTRQEFIEEISKANGSLIPITDKKSGKRLLVSARLGNYSLGQNQSDRILLIDVFDSTGEPMGHYDWRIHYDEKSPYANGNTSIRDYYVGNRNKSQEKADKKWRSFNAIDVDNKLSGLHIGSLLSTTSMIVLKKLEVDEVFLGALSPQAQNMWTKFDYLNCLPDTQSDSGIWISTQKIINQPRTNVILHEFTS